MQLFSKREQCMKYTCIQCKLELVVEDKLSELSRSYLTSSSVLRGFITPADWVGLSLGTTRFFVSVTFLKVTDTA